MFRDGVVLVDPFSASILPHEEIVPSRVESLVRALSVSGVQETPITVLVDGQLPPRLIVADGHHRCEAARRLAGLRGAPMAVAARFVDCGGATIRPAHRVVRHGPDGWAARCAAKLRARLSPGADPGTLAFCSRGSAVERYDCAGLSGVEQMRLLNDLCDESLDWTIEADESRALEELRAGRAEAAILVPALTIEDVLAAATSGRLLPPRSTNFQPKPQEASIRFVLTPVEAGHLNSYCNYHCF